MCHPDSELWHQAMVHKMEAHLENGTWELVKLPHRRKAIGSKWVFKVKRNPDGTVERYKARLVAKGFGQRPGVDFDEMFAPTTKWAALRAILALVALENLKLESIDISNAYLNSKLHDINVHVYEPQCSGALGDYNPRTSPLRQSIASPPAPIALWSLTSLQSDLRVILPHLHARTCRSSPSSDPSVAPRVLRHCSTVPRPLDTRPSRSLAYNRVRSSPQFVCAPRRLRRLAPRRATPPTSRQRDSQAFPATLQPPHRPAVRQRTGTAAE
jgi:hypothetical protein